jgi:hypothetical protein
MATEPGTHGLSAAQWVEKLSLISKYLERPTSLCIIGSIPAMFAGQPSRMTIDLDTWEAASDFAYADLQQACEKADLLFNPKDELEPDKPYIQIVEKGRVEIGNFNATTELMKEGSLVVVRPPFENIVAAKLTRMLPQDLTDIRYLLTEQNIDRARVEKIVRNFPGQHKVAGTDNLVYLDVLAPSKPRKLPTPRGASRAREMAG